MIYIKTLHRILKQGLIPQVTIRIVYCMKEKMIKIIDKIKKIIKDELVLKIMLKCVGLIAKTYGYLIHDGSEGKKGTKKRVIKNISSKIIKPV